jgi:DNA-binding CsgD family transcriptional regulator
MKVRSSDSQVPVKGPRTSKTSLGREVLALIGKVARRVGVTDFYPHLFDLFGSVVPHDFAWIVRYSRSGPPTVLWTQGVGKHLIDIYLRHSYYSSDPFFCDWSSNETSGVVLLKDAFASAGTSDLYRIVFQRKARYSDEMGMLLPEHGQSCVAFFVEKARGKFSARDETSARDIFPVVEGLHRAHVGTLFSGLGRSTSAEMRQLFRSPKLIVDCSGAPIHSSRSWRRLERGDPELRKARERIDQGEETIVPIGGNRFLEVERLSESFQLAPAGRMYSVTERTGQVYSEQATVRARRDLELLSPRERQVVALLVQGSALGEIAQRMKISKGTIKNYRLSLYRKLGISSERNLISRFWPLVNEFRSHPISGKH